MERAMDVAAIAVDFDVAIEVASHEAMIRQAYKDSVGVLTWSVGLTDATGHKVDRYVRNPSSLQHALNVYVWALESYADQVRDAFAGHKLTKAQFAAAVSFHWNTGAIRRASWVRHWKAGNTAAAKKAFMNWRTPGEIIGRRKKERDLFFKGEWSNDGTMTEFTRVTSRLTPDWSSGRRINVEAELKTAFAAVVTPTLDQTPKPGNEPAAPTLSPLPAPPSPEADQEPTSPSRPEPTPTATSGGFLSALAAWLRSLLPT